jgi:hypothetical protein
MHVSRSLEDDHSENLKFVSFGYDCRAGFQIRRLFGKERCLPTIFDRQVTPAEAICAYLDNDFRGMFERSDVEPVCGYLFNMRYGIRYSHEVEDAFKLGYEAGAAEHERLCDLTRDALSGRTRIAAVVCPRKPFNGPDEIARHLQRRFPASSCEVLVVEDRDPVESGEAAWRGNNQVWDAAFRQYNPKPQPTAVQRQIQRLKKHVARLAR